MYRRRRRNVSPPPLVPLKLEDQCLLHLVCHLEEYRPEILAFLPVHLRRRLLLNLPAADICQLENTAVSAGIDMEGTIWKNLAYERAQDTHFMSHICNVIAKNCDSTRARELLFSVRRCLDVTKWDSFQHSFAPIGENGIRYPTPRRYLWHWSRECKQVDLNRYLTETCKWMPLQVKLDNQTYSCFVYYHNVLTSVTFCNNFNFIPAISLMTDLSALFHQPQFSELELSFLEVKWEHLGILLPKFLSAPSEDKKKFLRFFCVRLPVDGTPPEPVDITKGFSSLPQNTLSLWHNNVPAIFCEFLSAYNYTNLLSSLTVRDNNDFIMDYAPTTILQHVFFADCKLNFQSSPEKEFIKLFQGRHLKAVHLCKCHLNKAGLLPALTEGLRGQVSVGSLEELDIRDNSLDESPEYEVEEFFDVLFTLPQLSNLRLNVHGNYFDPDHFSSMHDSWRMYARDSGKQLKFLEVHFLNNYYDSISELKDVAQSGDFLPGVLPI